MDELGDQDILRVITRLNIGGPARQVTLLAKALPDRGFPSHLVYGSIAEREGELSLAPGVPATRIPELRREMSPVDDARALRVLLGVLRLRKPAVVHTHLAKAGALGRIAAWRARVPAVVHTYHGHVLEGYFSAPVSQAILLAERRLARISDALIAVSRVVRDDLLGLGVGRPEQWRVIPLGLDLEPLLRTRPDASLARRALGLPEAGPVVGIVGRLTAVKEHQLFLEAAARVLRERPDVTFAVAGDGELRHELESVAENLLGDRCRFLGWVMDLPTLYAAMDVIVLTSRNEGTPVALIEAAAAARPVVATRVGGVADVVLDGRTGLLVRGGDVQSIAASLVRLLGSPGEAAALGIAGREWVAGRFSIDRLADDLACLYRDLLSRKGLLRGP
ncbi:MAG: glycosyltransferase [Actinomycetota bacterium]